MSPKSEIAGDVREIWKVARASLLKLATPDGATEPDLELLRDSFHDEFTDLYDEINSAAFNAGSGKNKDKLTKVEQKAKDLATELAETREALDTAHAKTPDVEKLKKDYERQVAKATGERDERIQSLSGQLSQMREERDLGSFEKALIEQGLKPRAAQSYKEIYRRNFQYDDDGNLQVLQPDSDTPFLTTGRGRAFDPLVQKLKKEADPDDLLANVDTNGGGVVRPGYGNRSSVPRSPALQRSMDPEEQKQAKTEAAAARIKAERDSMMGAGL